MGDRDERMRRRLDAEKAALTSAKTDLKSPENGGLGSIRNEMQTAMDLIAKGAQEKNPALIQKAVLDMIKHARSVRSPRAVTEALMLSAAVTEKSLKKPKKVKEP